MCRERSYCDRVVQRSNSSSPLWAAQTKVFFGDRTPLTFLYVAYYDYAPWADLTPLVIIDMVVAGVE